jgi:hypothetical protein
MISVSLESAMIAQFAGTSNNAGLGMGVFFSFWFITFYGGGIDVVGYVYCSEYKIRVTARIEAHNNDCPGEIFPTHIRCQGVAWSLVGTFLSTLVYVEAAPTALAKIKWGYYIIFVGLTAINILILYAWCPEVSCSSKEPDCLLPLMVYLS